MLRCAHRVQLGANWGCPSTGLTLSMAKSRAVRREKEKKKMKKMNVVQYARGDQGVEKAKRRNVKKTAKRTKKDEETGCAAMKSRKDD